MGPVRPASVGGNAYVLTAIDDYGGYAAVVPLKYKSEASEELMKITLGWARQLERGVTTVRTDRGTDYKKFDAWCESKGIYGDRWTAYTPQQNGRAERFNCTVTQKARAMLLHSGMAKKYWADAFATVPAVDNVSPRMKQTITPHELFGGTKPDVSHLQTFGCKVFCLQAERAQVVVCLE
eukprot:jgi/Ulvmu1/8082/UM004_0319.1